MKIKHNFLIIAPRYIQWLGQYYEFPIGLAYISSVLKSQGYPVTCLNLNHYDDTVESLIAKSIKENDIDIVCTGGLSIHFNKIKRILYVAKDIDPNIISILGGGIVSSDPYTIMKALKPDFGVIGEGEVTIQELASCLDRPTCYTTIEGLIYFNQNGSLIKNPTRKPIKNLGTIPYPDYQGFEIETYLERQMPSDEYHMYPFDNPRVIPVTASRSCPYKCTFCYHPLGNIYRQRPLDDLFNEIDLLKSRYKVNILSIVDELFSTNDERIEEFCSRIKDLNLKYLVQMRVDSVDKSTLKMLKDSGCIAISYGLESASNTILKSMKKFTTLSMIEKTLALTYDAEIGIQGNFIFGDIAETWETARETIDWWFKNKKYLINLTPIYIYPGTKLFAYAREKEIITDSIEFLEKECPVTNVSKLRNEEFENLLCEISGYRTENPYPAHVVSCRKMHLDPYKGDVFHLTVKCPHCKAIIEYRNIHQKCNNMYPLGCRIGCRSCNQRFDILPPMIHEKILNGDVPQCAGLFENAQKVAIYGAGLASVSVYQECLKMNKLVLYFIDDFKTGEWCDQPILHPDQIPDNNLPELTIFTCGSPRYAEELLTKMGKWEKTPKTLMFYTKGLSSPGNEYIFQFYYNLYFEKWLPLQKIHPEHK